MTTKPPPPERAAEGKFWWWAASEDAETYSGPEPTRAAALAAGTEEARDDEATAFALMYGGFEPLSYGIFDGDSLAERFEEHNEECCDEDGRLSGSGATPSQLLDLESRLEAVLRQWNEETGAWKPWAIKVEHAETILVRS